MTEPTEAERAAANIWKMWPPIKSTNPETRKWAERWIAEIIQRLLDERDRQIKFMRETLKDDLEIMREKDTQIADLKDTIEQEQWVLNERLQQENERLNQELAEAVEKPEYTEDGVPMLPIPEFCKRWECRDNQANRVKLELRNGFMVCPLCLSSYGEPAEATNPDGENK